MARAAVGWSVLDLAGRARVATTTINRFELDRGEPNESTVAVIQRAFEDAGIEFLNGDAPGVRIRQKPQA